LGLIASGASKLGCLEMRSYFKIKTKPECCHAQVAGALPEGSAGNVFGSTALSRSLALHRLARVTSIDSIDGLSFWFTREPGVRRLLRPKLAAGATRVLTTVSPTNKTLGRLQQLPEITNPRRALVDDLR